MNRLIITPHAGPVARVTPTELWTPGGRGRRAGIDRVSFRYDPVQGPVWEAQRPQVNAVADKWLIYDSFKEYGYDGTVDLDTDTIKCALFLSTSNAATLTHDEFGDLTNEHAAGFGYTAGGDNLVSPTWVRSGAVTTFDADDPVWSASGGSIICRFAVIYVNVTRNGVTDPLMGYSLLDNTPANVTATDGNNLSLTLDANGIFDLSGGDTV